MEQQKSRGLRLLGFYSLAFGRHSCMPSDYVDPHFTSLDAMVLLLFMGITAFYCIANKIVVIDNNFKKRNIK